MDNVIIKGHVFPTSCHEMEMCMAESPLEPYIILKWEENGHTRKKIIYIKWEEWKKVIKTALNFEGKYRAKANEVVR